ncbi:MAG: sigma-70 family RNA polymerase sigma factor [Bryobacteraceae bacterium]|nr:sigma-70 family RNA polymerase sigma factor [Bryobacteraceae bacterium]
MTLMDTLDSNHGATELSTERDPWNSYLSRDDAPGPGSARDERMQRLVEEIRAGDPRAEEELYRVFGPGVRFLLYRRLGPEGSQDELQEVFLILLEAVRKGQLREPQRLEAFIRGVVQRRIARAIHVKLQRQRLDGAPLPDEPPATGLQPDEGLGRRDTRTLLREVLRTLSAREREVLVRFYLREESKGQILAEMALTETQFRLLKWRAKAKFATRARERLRLG